MGREAATCTSTTTGRLFSTCPVRLPAKREKTATPPENRVGINPIRK
jgi:hypothetical protein